MADTLPKPLPSAKESANYDELDDDDPPHYLDLKPRPIHSSLETQLATSLSEILSNREQIWGTEDEDDEDKDVRDDEWNDGGERRKKRNARGCKTKMRRKKTTTKKTLKPRRRRSRPPRAVSTA
jgi:hypothetical protein